MKGRQPKRLGILTKPNEPRAVQVATQIAQWTHANSVELLVDTNLAEAPASARRVTDQEVAANSDVVIVLGGDGTMIAAARLVHSRGTPVIGINLGSLGYLTEYPVEDVSSAL
ncbi:MAG TPA: NAD(+)/NADH kinase, partial [Blastocatellia bacterium]|nr:NAD(+)/NADH kinase [Blastocatellia bacterium]